MPLLPFFKPKSSKENKPDYHKITCLNLRCMEEFEHYEMLFQLEPPKEVTDYRISKSLSNIISSIGESAQPSAKTRREIWTQPKSEFDDDDDDGYGDDGWETESGDDNETSGNNAAMPVDDAEKSRLEEMLEYYYGNTGFGYEYGKGEDPNYIRISTAQAQKTDSGQFPHNAYKEYLKGNPTTNYVVSIVDCYGHRTQKAVCPHCRLPIFSSAAGTYETFILPVLGVSQSGKTVLLHKSFQPFVKNTAPDMLTNGSVLESAGMKKYFAEIGKRLKTRVNEETGEIEGGEIAATLGVERLHSEIESSNRKILMCTFDLPGEYIANETNKSFEDFRKNELSRLLKRADGMIIIICPMQIENIAQSDPDLSGVWDPTRMKGFDDMIRLLSSESDPAEIVKGKNLPICVVMTMIDLFRLNKGNNKKINISGLDSEVREMLYNIIERKEVSTLEDRPDEVNMGEIERYAQQTEKMFKKIMHNEYNSIINRFAGEKHNVRCFAVSCQGSDANDEVNRPPIRPNEVFYWLFAKMGIYKKPEVKDVRKR